MRTTSRLLAAMAILAMACSDETSSDPEGVLGPGTEPSAGERALRDAPPHRLPQPSRGFRR
jgi:hypothetical protein